VVAQKHEQKLIQFYQHKFRSSNIYVLVLFIADASSVRLFSATKIYFKYCLNKANIDTFAVRKFNIINKQINHQAVDNYI
jgi:hypothetical protein